jgi:predicted DNA-binding antitoxin AbrB/MazE fold protein
MNNINAIFEQGVFNPQSFVDLPEGSLVRLSIEKLKSSAIPPDLSIENRRLIRLGVVESMRRTPLPLDAPRFSRNQVYDRS